jgi:tetratricopeptide (TPR) repeat protein
MSRNERRAAVKQSRSDQNALSAKTAAFHKAGMVHLRAGRQLDAQMCCQQALAADPRHADSLHLMGLVSLQAKHHDIAVEWITLAIRQNPKAEYLSDLGIALAGEGRHEDALKSFEKSVQIKPDDAELWKNYGCGLLDMGRSAEALLTFQHVLKLKSGGWEAAFQIGLCLSTRKPEYALSYLDRAAELQPDHAEILEARGITLHNLARFEEALAASRLALELNPDSANLCHNIGVTLQFLNRDTEALSWFERALALQPALNGSLNNKALALTQLHRFDEAVAIYRDLKAADPANPEHDWNLSLIDLLTGDFGAGWTGREVRWKIPHLSNFYPKFKQPQWLGESIEGKTLLVYSDEGLGDAIQFVRYLPMVTKLGVRIILVVQEAAHSLLSGMAGVSECFPQSAAALPEFDFHCPSGCLPLIFNTRLETIPSMPSYLAPEAARVKTWESRLGPRDRLRIGLVWSGNPKHKNDRNRSTSLQMFSRLLDIDATFVSLQKDPKPSDRELLNRTGILDLTEHLADLSETAALISCLDLVISVDTSVAHLAAALGRPTWILLPRMPDWRWLLDREDSPWYPSARLFRQDDTREYGGVLDRVRSELLRLV